MKIKAFILAASILGATYFVTSTPENNVKDNDIQKTAVDKRKIRIPTHG